MAIQKSSDSRDQPKKQNQPRRGLTRYLISLLLIVVPAGVLYYMHVRDQTNYHQERAFRALSEAGILFENNLKSFARLPATMRNESKPPALTTSILETQTQIRELKKQIDQDEKHNGSNTSSRDYDDKTLNIEAQRKSLEKAQLKLIYAKSKLESTLDEAANQKLGPSDSKNQGGDKGKSEKLQVELSALLAEREQKQKDIIAANALVGDREVFRMSLRQSYLDFLKEESQSLVTPSKEQSSLYESSTCSFEKPTKTKSLEETGPVTVADFQHLTSVCYIVLATEIAGQLYETKEGELSATPKTLEESELTSLHSYQTIKTIRKHLKSDLFKKNSEFSKNRLKDLRDNMEEAVEEAVEDLIEIDDLLLKDIVSTNSDLAKYQSRKTEIETKLGELEAKIKEIDEATRTAWSEKRDELDSEVKSAQKKYAVANTKLQLTKKSYEESRRTALDTKRQTEDEEVRKREDKLTRNNWKLEQLNLKLKLERKTLEFQQTQSIQIEKKNLETSVRKNVLFAGIQIDIDPEDKQVSSSGFKTEQATMHVTPGGTLKSNFVRKQKSAEESETEIWLHYKTSLPLSDPLKDLEHRSEFSALFLGGPNGNVLFATETYGTTKIGRDRSNIDHFSPYTSQKGALAQTILSLDDIFKSVSTIDTKEYNEETEDISLFTDSSYEISKRTKKRSESYLNVLSSTLIEIEFGGEQQMVFIQPIKLNIGGLETSITGISLEDEDAINLAEPTIFYLVGVIPKTKFLKAALQIPSEVVGYMLIALVGLILAIPILRVLLGGPTFSLGRKSTIVLVLAGLWGPGAVYISVYHFISNGLQEEKRHSAGHLVSEYLKQDFEHELTLAQNNLDGVTEELESYFQRSEKDHSLTPNYIDGYWQVGENIRVNPLPWHETATKGSKYPRPPFDIAALLTDEGIQCGPLIMYRNRDLATLNIGHRQYLKSARDWQLLHPTDGVGLALERVANVSDGVFTTVIAQPYIGNQRENWTWQDTDKTCTPVVQILGFDSLVIKKPALPRGLTFAVINDVSGQVVAHSKQENVLVENFFHETDDDPVLMSRINRRLESGKTGLSGRYRGGLTTFHTSPIRNTHWTVVVMDDQSMMAQEQLAKMIVAISLFSTILLALIIFLYAARVAWKSNTYNWIFTGRSDSKELRIVRFLPYVLIPTALMFIYLLPGEAVLLVPLVAAPFALFGLHVASNQVTLNKVYKLRAKLWGNPFYIIGIVNIAFIITLLLSAGNTNTTETTIGPYILPGTWFTIIFGSALFMRWRENVYHLNSSAESIVAFISSGKLETTNESWQTPLNRLLYITLVVSLLPAVAANKVTNDHISQITHKADGVAGAIAIDRNWGSLKAISERAIGGDLVSSKSGQGQNVYEATMAVRPRKKSPDGNYVFFGSSMSHLSIDIIDIETSHTEKNEDETSSIAIYPLNNWFINRIASNSMLGNELFHYGVLEHQKGSKEFDRCNEKSLSPYIERGAWTAMKDGGLCYIPFNRPQSPIMVTAKTSKDVEGPALFWAMLITLLVSYALLNLLDHKLFGKPLRKQKLDQEENEELGYAAILERNTNEAKEGVAHDSSRPKNHYALLGPSVEDWAEMREASSETARICSAAELAPPPNTTKREHWVFIDCNLLDRDQLIISHLDQVVDQPEMRSIVLAALEKILSAYKGQVIIAADQQMLFRIIRPDSYHEQLKSGEYPNNLERKRWSTVFAQFQKIKGDPPQTPGRYDKLWEAKANETRWTTDVFVDLAKRVIKSELSLRGAVEEFKRLGSRGEDKKPGSVAQHVTQREIRLLPNKHPLQKKFEEIELVNKEPHDIINEVEHHAGPYFRHIWMLCTFEEKVVLHALSQGHLVNTQSNRALEHLRKRGLVVLEPLPQITSSSFANFVRNAESEEVFAAWEEKMSNDLWSTLRIPILLIIILFGAFIFSNAQQEIEATLAVLTGVVTALPLLLRAFSAIRGSGIG